MADRNAIVKPIEESGIQKKAAAAIISSLDETATAAIISSLDETAIAACQGKPADEVMSVDITLFTMIIDGSSSMQGARAAVSKCHDELVAALKKVPNSEGLLVSCWIFNTERNLVHGFVGVDEIPAFHYLTAGSTALYDTVLAGMTGQLSYEQEHIAEGAEVKNIIVVLTDGGDCASKIDPDGSKTKLVAEELRDKNYLLAYVGFGSEGTQMNEASARLLAERIGFREVIGAGKNEEGISSLFRKLTKAVIEVSSCTSIQRTSLFGG